MQLLDLIKSQLTPEVHAAMGQKTGLDSGALQSILPAAMAVLTGGLAKRSEGQGAAELAGMLDSDGDGIPDALESTTDQGMEKGKALLGQLLGGGRTQNAEMALAKTGGGNQQQMGALLAMLAPIVMKQLANGKKAGGLDAGGLAAMLGQAKSDAQGALPNELSGLAKMFDADGDGNIMDDLMNMAGKSGLGGLLGR